MDDFCATSFEGVRVVIIRWFVARAQVIAFSVPFLALLVASPTLALAANGDCAQPVSNGAGPVASDCLFILNAAVAVQTCSPTCTCDINGSGGQPNATDALVCLSASVGIPGLLDCQCGEVTDSDDFNDNAKDPAKWGTDDTNGNGTITEQITRLEYRCSSPTSNYDGANRPWIKSNLPYDTDWEVQIDVRNISDPEISEQVSSYGLELVNPSDDNDYLYVEIYASTLGGLPARNGFYGEIGFDNDSAWVDTGDVNLEAGAVRLTFDAASKVVTLFYDVPGGDYTWIEFGSFGIDGNGGDDGNGNWGLAASDEILLDVYGYSEQMTIPPAQVFGDNFAITRGP